jgi:hypothetical protein
MTIPQTAFLTPRVQGALFDVSRFSGKGKK